MSRKGISLLVAGAAMLGCGAGMVAHQTLESRAFAQAAPGTGQWEHVCIELQETDFMATPIAQALGKQGFEMAAMSSHFVPEIGGDSRYHACFKRPAVYMDGGPTITPLPAAAQ